MLYTLGQSAVWTRRFRAKLERFTVRVALIVIAAVYLAGVIIRIELAIRE
jgi:hypothetical protein